MKRFLLRKMKLGLILSIGTVCAKKLDENALKEIFDSFLDAPIAENRKLTSVPREVQADPIQKVNRFLTLGGLDHFYETKQNNTDRMNEIQSCQKKWRQVGDQCMLLLNRNQKKIVHKRSCLKSGAKLVSVSVSIGFQGTKL